MRDELARCRSGGGDGGMTTTDSAAPMMGSASAFEVGPLPGLPVTNGMTPAGEAWALKALHPNGEEATAVLGIPDHVSVPVVTPEFRTNFVVPGSPTAQNEDVDVICLPFADLPCIYRRYKSGTQPSAWSSWNAVWNATLTTGVKLVSDAFVSNTDLSDKTVKGTTVPVRSSNLAAIYGYGRVTHKGITCHLDAPALSDQGRVVAGQLALPFDSERAVLQVGGWDSTTKKKVYSTGLADFYSLDNVPLEENCLVQASPGAAAWEAREGVYVPLRFRDPAHQFTPSGSAKLLGTTISSGENSALALVEEAQPPTGYEDAIRVKPVVRMLLNCQTAVVLFRGISNTANIHCKVITGLESLVETCSAVSPYQRMSPALDCEAINSVTRLGQELPQAFPAAYNDFGGLFGFIKNVTAQLRNKVLRKIPGVGKFWDWQEEKIYKPMGLGLNAPMHMPTATGWRDPLSRVYDRMSNRRTGYRPFYG